MPSAPYFSLPLHASHQPLSLRAARYKQPGKRKRDHDNEKEEEQQQQQQQQEEGDFGSTTANEPSSGRAAIAAAEGEHAPLSGFTPVTQRSLAALAKEPLPDDPFPHQPAHPLGSLRQGRRNATPQICQEELANLSPPLFVPNSSYMKVSPVAAPQQRSQLRRRHLSVLMMIFHRCVLDGDFLRAGRAWGMILRAESGGKGIHLRKEGRWGIGAEILLRRATEISMLEGTAKRKDGEESSKKTDPPGAWFTRQGFEKAKEYYERLTLQYQFRKWAPHSVSSLDFYPAMFGTWIYIVQAEYKVGQNGSPERPESSLLLDHHFSGGEPTPYPDRQDGPHESRASEQENLRKKTLKEAEEIAARMDELMLSPPYSDSLQLWKLRGMVSLWISDLCMSPYTTANETTHASGTKRGIDITGESISRRNHEQNLRKRNDEIERAKAAFEKAGHEGIVIREGHMSFEDSTNDGATDDSQGK